MKRTLFLAATGSTVLSVVLAASALGGAGSATADTLPKKKPTPTPTTTTPPPPVADGPGCWDAQEAHLFWHRDVIPGSAAKLNAGEIAATVYLAGDDCPGETYRFELLDQFTGSQVLASFDVTGADHNTVNLTRFVKLGPNGEIGTDVNEDYATIRLQMKVFKGGVLMATAPTAGAGTPGVEITDGDLGSPALNGFH